jgi:lysophospholipase L1-like esterase
LFVGHHSPGFSATLQFPDGTPKTLTPTDKIVLQWSLGKAIKKFTMEFSGQAEITGLSVDGTEGVAVDNIPLRGSSGTFFSEIDIHSIAPVMEMLNVQLILMEFGGNTVPYIKGEKNVTAYKESMAKQIQYVNKIYPTARIVLIGPADMSTKINGRLQSYPLLNETIQGLKEAALENGAAFWDMYEVMGGENSMIDWVNEKPALASPDHIHFTPRGANRIAEMFYESLMNYHAFTVLLNRLKE